MNSIKIFKHVTPRIFQSIIALSLIVIASQFGYATSPDDLAFGGALVVGMGETTWHDINALLEKQGKAFEEFKNRNDEKISSLERDVINFFKKANRPKMGDSSDYAFGFDESKSDLATYIRSRGETKGMFSSSGPDGGWMVAPVLANGIGTIVRNASALRELVTFVPMEVGGSYEEVISTTPVGAVWVGETQARPATATPQLVKVTTELHEEYAEPVISQKLADDSGVAMVDFLVNESSISFSEAEERALFYGDGINKPRGLDTIPTESTEDSSRAFGTIEHIATGTSGAFATTASFDAVKKVFYRLRAGYRKNAKWVCNSETALELSKLKDGQGNYLWDEGSVKDGTPPTLLGKPVVICETAPGIAADAKALWFGDWDQALRAIERPGNKVLLDPYIDKPNIRVYVYRRIGLNLRNSNAIKCLKFSAS
ncbi:MAG: phage major capsid protein [Methylovulum sp.]|nr:phage major capsid protein [Methylovulum sp.]